MSYVGQSVRRLDAVGKVTGEAPYPGDIDMPNLAYMKILFARRAHAIIRRIDTSAAEAMDGVLAVFTAKDVPVNEYGLIVPDQPVLCGPGSSKPFTDRVRFVGDQVALVVAESEQIADKARAAIVVEYEDLPLVDDPLEAAKDGAVLLHPDRGSNVFVKYRIRKGSVEEAFQRADVIIEGEYRTPVQEHAYLQPEAGLGYIDEEGRVTVITGGQWVHEDQEQIAHSLNLPKDRVRVIYPAIGGAFGGREDMSVQIVLGLAAIRLHERGINRPVKIIWNREESMIGHHKRHAFYIRTRWGATRDGRVVAVEADVTSDGGAYVYTSGKVLGNATLLVTGPYDIDNVKVDTRSVYTNHIPGGAFRGFGGPQAAFAAEMQMNKLALALNMDPVELRARNVFHEGTVLSVMTPLPPGVTMPEVLEKTAQAGGWEKTATGWQRRGMSNRNEPGGPIRRGTGVAIGYKNVGFSFGAPEHCWATIELHGGARVERAVLRHAGAEVGQGSHSAFVQMAAEALDLPMECIQLIAADTAYTDNSGSVSASRMTFMAGNAIRGAAQAALEKWDAEERPAVASYMYRPPKTEPLDPETGKSEPNFAYGYVGEVVEVEVDTETGQVRLLKVICVDDVGKAINPQQVLGQVEGAVVQAAGYTLMEDFIEKDGRVLTPYLSNYLIPTVLDIPETVESHLLEYADPIGPWGARGMGEMPYLPLAAAIVSAVHDATGVWINDFPLTAERVFAALHGGKGE